MNITLLTFGEKVETHSQANLAILSLLNDPHHFNKIIVVTDNAKLYTKLLAHPQIVIEEIANDTLKDWLGRYSFFWRIKIKALELIVNKYTDAPIMYLDSDTVLKGSLAELKSMLDAGHHFMHLNEGYLCKAKTKTEKLMWKQVAGKTFGGVTISSQHCMWNAGVVGIPRQTAKQTISLALQICDDMCAANVTRRLIEQFAFSVALSETNMLKPADRYFAHYWSNKSEWNLFANLFFAETQLLGLGIEESIENLESRRADFPPIKVKISSTKAKLNRLLDNIFERRILD
jgi:hypothetical protein